MKTVSSSSSLVVIVFAAALAAVTVPVALGFGQATVNENDWEKAAGGRLKFDVASIHLGEPGKFMPPSFPLNIDDTPTPPGGSFRADFPLRVYIEFAYKLQLSREQRERCFPVCLVGSALKHL